MSHPTQHRRNYRVCSLVRTRSVKSGFLLYLTIRLFIFGNSEQIEPLFISVKILSVEKINKKMRVIVSL